MPLYTFICAKCGAAQDHLCKVGERKTEVIACDQPLEVRDASDPAKCDGEARWSSSPELVQMRDFSKGKYGMKAIFEDGTKRRVQSATTNVKRSDS